jgi:hypothetical protein
MKTIWSFGCSFSAMYGLITLEDTYPNLIAKKLNYNIKNTSFTGNCNEKIFFDLLENIDKIKFGDIITYQFSSFDRVGFFHNNLNNSYICSNGLLEFGVEHKKNIIDDINNLKIEDLENLLNYLLKWQPKKIKFLFEMPLNLLKQLKKDKNINYCILFMSNDINKNENYKFNYNEMENIIFLPTNEHEKNISMSDFVLYNKLNLGYEFPDTFPNDIHPGFEGHKKIAEIIEKKIKL